MNGTLEVSVVNLWVNRLIGDEQLPDDCEWKPHSGTEVLAQYPQWLLDNKPRPTSRVAFTVWKHWTKDDPLMESGLLGPVRIVVKAPGGGEVAGRRKDGAGRSQPQCAAGGI